MFRCVALYPNIVFNERCTILSRKHLRHRSAPLSPITALIRKMKRKQTVHEPCSLPPQGCAARWAYIAAPTISLQPCPPIQHMFPLFVLSVCVISQWASSLHASETATTCEPRLPLPLHQTRMEEKEEVQGAVVPRRSVPCD